MRKAIVRGTVPRSSRWSQSQADAFFGYLLHDGSGADFAEVNGLADSAAYTGTAPTFGEYGAELAGDGGAWLPAAVNQVFQLQHECRVIVAAWLTINNATMSGQDTVFAVNTHGTVAGTLPIAGHFRLDLVTTDIRANFTYRNAAANNNSAPANQSVSIPTTLGNAGPVRHHVGIILHSNGSAVDYKMFLDGSVEVANSFTVNGAGPLQMPEAANHVVIGARMSPPGTLVTSEALGTNTDTELEALMLWRKNGATDAEAVALMQKFYNFRAEAPF
ncbi:MAG: hypothetical protein RLW42_13105 [Gammaproteobacteria bacterium]